MILWIKKWLVINKFCSKQLRNKQNLNRPIDIFSYGKRSVPEKYFIYLFIPRNSLYIPGVELENYDVDKHF